MNTLLTLLLTLLPAADLFAQSRECQFTAERSATIDAAGAEMLRLHARAGSLRIVGRSDLSEIRVRGEACASRAELLEGIRLATDRSGGVVRVEAVMPEDPWHWRGGNNQALLDLVVEVPETLALDVEDSSGGIEIRNVGPLLLDDSSGDIELLGIRGDARVKDSSGGIYIEGVEGSLWLDDSSGGIDAREVRGSVIVERDSSGDIRITNVAGDVLVQRDSSGDIEVAGIGGDFVVERDGSGSIRYRDVAGDVRIPEDKRRRQ